MNVLFFMADPLHGDQARRPRPDVRCVRRAGHWRPPSPARQGRCSPRKFSSGIVWPRVTPAIATSRRSSFGGAAPT